MPTKPLSHARISSLIDISLNGVVSAVVDSQKYQIFLRLHKGLVSKKPGRVGIANFTCGGYFGIFTRQCPPYNLPTLKLSTFNLLTCNPC